MYNNNKKWTQDKGRKRTSDDGPDLQQTRPQHDLIDQIMKQLEGAQKARAKIQTNKNQPAPTPKTTNADTFRKFRHAWAEPGRTTDEDTWSTMGSYGNPAVERIFKVEYPSVSQSSYRPPDPYYLSLFDEVRVQIIPKTSNLHKGIISGCLPNNLYHVKVGDSTYRKHRAQLIPADRYQYERAVYGTSPSAYTKMKQKEARKRTEARREAESSESSDQEPPTLTTCSNMWHRPSPASHLQSLCHRCKMCLYQLERREEEIKRERELTQNDPKLN